jgi:ferredoxin
MTDAGGAPLVRVAIANFAPELDIWAGLRNPAQVGRYPLMPAEIWEHYAATNFTRVRADGSSSILALPETFEEALGRIRRVVIVCGMLAVNPAVYEDYAQKIDRGDLDPPDTYCRATAEVADIVDKAMGKLALSLMAPQRAVVPMTEQGTQKIVERTRGEYRRGTYHGPCNELWPQNSIAVMTGLMRFGVHRLPFRDEVDVDGSRQRLYGRYRSIVIFDQEVPVSNGGAGVGFLDAERLAWLYQVNDYTSDDPAATAERYCTYNLTESDSASVCARCIEACPSSALANSSPDPNGLFGEETTSQTHRFWDDKLAFDFGNCLSDRSQKADLFEDYVCARCEAICAARGMRKAAADIKRINGPG